MLFSILSALTLAMADTTKKVVVESNDPSLSGKGLADIHFGAGMNGVLFSDKPTDFFYNSTGDYIYKKYSDDRYYVYFGQDENELIGSFYSGSIPEYGSEDMTFVENNYLTINGSSSVFYACSNLSFDPYGYTKNGTKGVAIYSEPESAPSGCVPITIRVE